MSHANYSLAEPSAIWPATSSSRHNGLWLTTADAARILRITDDGVRWLVAHQQLACTRTQSRQYLFQPDDVRQLAEARLAASLAHNSSSSRKRQRPHQRIGARQLWLPLLLDVPLTTAFRPAKSLGDHRAKACRIIRESAIDGRDNKSYVNQPVTPAGGAR